MILFFALQMFAAIFISVPVVWSEGVEAVTLGNQIN